MNEKQRSVGTVPPRNPLGYAPVGKLLMQYAIPSVISTLLASLYNMVDQMFIGQRIGYLGNAATTVAYPLTFMCGALTILFSRETNASRRVVLLTPYVSMRDRSVRIWPGL